MDGSDEPRERFTHVCQTAVHANVQGDGGIRIALGTQYTVHHYGVGPHAAGVQWTTSGNDLLIWGPTDSGVALSVTPNTPTVVARGWYWPPGGGGVTISVAVVVAFGSPMDELNPYAILNVPIPEIPIYHAVSTPGGGRVVVGAGAPGIEGGISVNGMGPSDVYFDAWAMPGYQFNGWTGDLDSFGIWATPNVSTFIPIRAVANFIRMKQLTFTVTGDGDPPECTGYCTADPAGRYYGVGSIATISAHEQPGHCFRRWKASCDAWPTSVTNSDILSGAVPGHRLDSDDVTYQANFGTGDVKIKMDTDRTVEAVMLRQDCAGCAQGPVVTASASQLEEHVPGPCASDKAGACGLSNVRLDNPQYTISVCTDCASGMFNFSVNADFTMLLYVCDWMRDLQPPSFTDPDIAAVFCTIVQSLKTYGCVNCSASCNPPIVWGSTQCVRQHEMMHIEMFRAAFPQEAAQLAADQVMRMPMSGQTCAAAVAQRQAQIVDRLTQIAEATWNNFCGNDTLPIQAAQACNDALAQALCAYGKAQGWPSCSQCPE